jgi:hypothetical protein
MSPNRGREHCPEDILPWAQELAVSSKARERESIKLESQRETIERG